MSRARSRATATAVAVAVAVVFGGVACSNKKKKPAPSGEAERPPRPLPDAAAPARPDPFDAPVTAVEVGAESARIWARLAGAAEVELELRRGDGAPMRRLAPVDPSADYTARLTIDGLVGGAAYTYSWKARDAGDAEIAAGQGRFVVPPQASTEAPVTFAFSGDLGGQNVCRDAARGYPIIERLAPLDLAFFIGLGDMIYADNPCLARGAGGNAQVPGLAGPAKTLDEFRRAWRYNRADPGLAGLLKKTSYVAVWDDHEIENNFGPDERGGLFEVGLRAFREHNPVPAKRFYRSLRWGAYLEIFFLDLRSYRSPNTAPDDDKKTMLGAEQTTWLLAALPASTARHKVVVSSVPIAIPTGDATIGIDSWVGFKTELAAVFRRLAAAGVTRLVFLTTDVHFAAAHRFKPAPGLEVTEIVVGPMSAGLFPTRELDATFSPERLLFHAPEKPDALSYDEAQAYMTAGIVEVDGERLAIRVENADGDVVWRTEISSR